MGFRFQRRLRLKGGLGINLSKSGGSFSYRNKLGSVGGKGFSIRTGIPGLSFRQSWGKDTGVALLIFSLAFLAVAVLVFVIQLLVKLLPVLCDYLVWVALTTYDFGRYLVEQISITWRKRFPNQPRS